MASCESKNGTYCPPTQDLRSCAYQLTLNRDACISDNYVTEALNIAGAKVNVFKLLGLHEQGLLVDLTGNGTAISSGDILGFSASNTFDKFQTTWRSKQRGDAVIAQAYIGYDFGQIKLDNGRDRYGIETYVKHNIATIRIKQGPNTQNRVTKVRIERSEDGVSWYGAAIVMLPDNSALNYISFKHTTPSRFWRVRPIAFNGGPTDFWEVAALELIDYESTQLETIEDQIFLENRDREYATTSILLKAFYNNLEIQTDLSRFGIELPTQQFVFQVSFSACVLALGRPIVIGDILEIPSEIQYTPQMTPVKKFVEVTDVTWASNGFTPNWQPLLLSITTEPMMATQETQDIFGGLGTTTDSTGLVSGNDGNSSVFQDLSGITSTIAADANTDTPEAGSDSATIQQYSENQVIAAREQGVENLQDLSLNPKTLYVEDGMPPNGLPYTEGNAFPDNPANGDYHRLTYVGLAENIPPKLYRYSTAKAQWIFLETDKRELFNPLKPFLQDFINSPNSIPPNEIEK